MAEEREREAEEQGSGGTPFDEEPPVDPTSQQVGNSNARFFMPREKESEGEGEETDAEDEAEEGGSDPA